MSLNYKRRSLNKNNKKIFHSRSKLLEYKTKYASNQTILPALPPLAFSIASSESLTVPSSSAELQQLWRFSSEDVFGLALNGFLEQLAELQTIFEAAVTFQSLEKLEIGGCRGKMLTERMRQVCSYTYKCTI